MDRFRPAEIHGIHAIVYALFDEREMLARAAMRRQVELCLAAGVHGMAALGLATECSKLSERERHTLMDWVAEDTNAQVPLAITVSGATVAEQIGQVRHAERVGADWLILQLPDVGKFSAAEYMRFLGRVADAATCPVAIQNAPGFMGRGLTGHDLRALLIQHPNIQLIKGEGPAVEIADLFEAVEGRIPIFNGRAGLELIDTLRTGCRGLILAPDCIDHAVRAYTCFRAGDEPAAELAYQTMLPAVVFTMQGLENLICYGKRLFGARAGIEIHDRAPAQRPTRPGLEMTGRFARALGPLGRQEP